LGIVIPIPIVIKPGFRVGVLALQAERVVDGLLVDLAEAAAAAAAHVPSAADDDELESMRAEVMAMLQNRAVPLDDSD
jgi:hypothetical protein